MIIEMQMTVLHKFLTVMPIHPHQSDCYDGLRQIPDLDLQFPKIPVRLDISLNTCKKFQKQTIGHVLLTPGDHTSVSVFVLFLLQLPDH